MKYDIFISYRRIGGYDTAKHINDLLVRDGYRVSFDIDTLRSGFFDVQLLSRIEQCKDFILIVDEHAFDRSLDVNFDRNKDWLRCELAHAIEHKKNIIPVFLSGVSGFPEGLPEDIAAVTKSNGPEYNRYYFNDFYKALKSRFLVSKSRKKWIISIIVFFLILIGAVMYFTLNTSTELKYVQYQNPYNPHTTDREQFDDFVKKSTNELVRDTSAINYNKFLEYWESIEDEEGVFNMGLLYYDKRNPRSDLGKAINYFKLSAKYGYAQAQYSLAVCYYNGIYVKQDLQKATDLYFKAAIQGYAPAQNDYAICTDTMDNKARFEWFEKSANQDYAPAQFHLAYCYSNNVYVSRDFDKYFYWLKKSADQDYNIAKCALAVAYIDTPEEYSEYRNQDLGVTILEELVNEEFPFAYQNLASCYFRGICVDKDMDQGIELLKVGAETKKDAVLLFNLGLIYFNPPSGVSVLSRDYKKGLDLLYRSADLGYPLAQYYIGEVYQKGLGVTKNIKKAQEWFELAAMQNVTRETVQGLNAQNNNN